MGAVPGLCKPQGLGIGKGETWTSGFQCSETYSTIFSEAAQVQWGKIMNVGYVEFEVPLRGRRGKSEQAIG